MLEGLREFETVCCVKDETMDLMSWLQMMPRLESLTVRMLHTHHSFDYDNDDLIATSLMDWLTSFTCWNIRLKDVCLDGLYHKTGELLGLVD